MITSPLSQPQGAAQLPAEADRILRAQQEAAHDAVLVRRFLAGDVSAFEEIVAHYRRRMIQATLPIIGNLADAQELAQDTFVRAWRGLARFRGDSSLSSWLHRIALNLAKNRLGYYLRRRRDRAVSFDAPHTPGEDETYADAVENLEPNPATDAARREFSAVVAECTKRLNPAQREMLELLNVRHRSYGEIGTKLGMRSGTVKSKISRARRRLQELMAESCPEFAACGPMADWFEPAHSLARVRRCA